MELKRRRGLMIVVLVAWSVVACLLFSRWGTTVSHFFIGTNAIAARNGTQTSKNATSQIKTKELLRTSKQPPDRASPWVFLPVPADDLALRVVNVHEENISRSLKLQKLKVRDSGLRQRFSARGMNRSRSWDFFDYLVSSELIDFRDAARYPLDEFLSPMDQDILADEPAKDLTTIASPGTSLLELVGLKQGSKVNIGQNVTVRVTLKDAKGRPVLKGGHQVRVWMVSKKPMARSAAGDVTDLRNGTYVTSLPVLWPGPIQVLAALQRPREFQRTVLSVLSKMKNMLHILASFVNGTKEEVTLCSYIPVVPGYPEVCNLTTLNSGLPWYCGRPTTPGVQCGDWTWASNTHYPRHYAGTDTENAILLPYIAKDLGLGAQLTVLKEAGIGIQFSVVPQGLLAQLRDEDECPPANRPLVDPKPCRPLTPRETWEDHSPRGYWENNKWHPLAGCPLPQINRSVIVECLRETRFMSLGDSNARYVVSGGMRTFAGCSLLNMAASKLKHVPLAYYCPEHQLLLSWHPHAFPFFSGSRSWGPSKVKKSPGRILKELPATGKYVIMIHLYMHFAVQHIYVYRLHVRDAAQGVRNLLQRNPTVKIFIRGPHALNAVNVNFQSDLHASRTHHVLQEEFRDLRDRVVFLNMMDMTVANENCDIHPNIHVVRTLCEMIVSHVCPT